jgi:hypothetical protein
MGCVCVPSVTRFCDYKLAVYNQGQVERLEAEYYWSYSGHSGTVIARKESSLQV